MMTPDDLAAREAIRDTLARYNMAGDSLRPDAFLSVFAEDAVLESANRVNGAAWRHEGRAGIAAWIAPWRGGSGPAPASDRARPTLVRHNLATSLIELTGADTATVRSYFTVYTQIGPDHGGVYDDRLRREGGSWLIAHRRVRTEWFATGSLFATD